MLFRSAGAGLVREAPLRMGVVAARGALDGFVPVLGALLMKLVIDGATGAARLGATGFALATAAWLLTMMAQYGMVAVATYQIEMAGEKTTRALSMRLVDKALSLQGLAVFEAKGFQETSQWLNWVDAPVRSFIYQASDLLKSAVQFAAVFAIFSGLEFWVPLALALSVLPGMLTASRNAEKKSAEDQKEREFERQAHYFRGVALFPESAKELRIFSFDRLFRKKNDELFRGIEATKAAFHKRTVRAELLGSSSRILAAGLVFMLMASRARRGELSAGSLAMYLQAIFQFSASLLAMVNTWTYMRTSYDFFSRYFGFMATADSLDLSRSTAALAAPLESICFENVSFGYPGGPRVLEGVSFTLGRGDSLALVGENGAGKSTIVKLMARLYDPDEGTIYANGRDIRELEPAAYRARISAIFQDYQKYELSLAENVFAGERVRPLAEAELPELLRDDALRSLPEGEDTVLGSRLGGRELSGGQWQRVAILRGLAKEHDLLLVDEPTASIDPIEEAAVFRSLLAAKSSMSLLVTHRLGSIRQATRILVLKAGRVLAEGDHKTLLGSSSYYAGLYDSQASMYREA